MISIFLPSNNSSLFDILTLIISSLAIIFSTVSAFYSFKLNKNINNINLNSIYHNKIFDEIIIEKLPRSIDKIKFRDEKLVDEGGLEDTLGELKKKIRFYKYKNKVFFENLSRLIMDVDDKIAVANNQALDQKKFDRIKRDIEAKVDELYKIIENEYLGVERDIY